MFQETFKNFNINFNALNERNTVSSGDLLTGQVSFDLSKDTKINSISIRFKGEASVQWSTSSGSELQYFDLKAVIMQTNSSMHSLYLFGCIIDSH